MFGSDFFISRMLNDPEDMIFILTEEERNFGGTVIFRNLKNAIQIMKKEFGEDSLKVIYIFTDTYISDMKEAEQVIETLRKQLKNLLIITISTEPDCTEEFKHLVNKVILIKSIKETPQIIVDETPKLIQRRGLTKKY